MNKTFKLIVVIPIGPTTNHSFVQDTLKSVNQYCTDSTKVILVNDSQKIIDDSYQGYDCDIVNTARPMGKQAGLYYSLCLGYEHALNNYNFSVLLRMDDDALITGYHPEEDVLKFFKRNNRVGIIGSYNLTWEGTQRDLSPIVKQINRENSALWRMLNWLKIINTGDISFYLDNAKKNGYVIGEHVLGGVCFYSAQFLKDMQAQGALSHSAFRGSKLEEDQIMGIVALAHGYLLGDFVTKDHPMCVKWKGLPTHPAEIMRLKKKVIHSVRYYQDMNEVEVRKQFQKFRKNHLKSD